MKVVGAGKVWRECNQLQPSRIGAVSKLMKMVARDGIEPPTPAFSGMSDQQLTGSHL